MLVTIHARAGELPLSGASRNLPALAGIRDVCRLPSARLRERHAHAIASGDDGRQRGRQGSFRLMGSRPRSDDAAVEAGRGCRRGRWTRPRAST